MRKRESDLKKLVQHIRSQGVTVTFKDLRKEKFAGYYVNSDGTSAPAIFINSKGTSLIFQLLTLLHEYGHHLDYTFREWPKKVFEADKIFEEKGISSPLWVKKTIWDIEERANEYILPVAEELEITIPLYLFYYDLEKTRKKLRLDLEKGKIKTSRWKKEKELIRKRLRDQDVRRRFYQRCSYLSC